LDFTPEDNTETPIMSRLKKSLLRKLSLAAYSFHCRSTGDILKIHSLIGTSMDTGHKIYRRYGNNPFFRYEYIRPVLDMHNTLGTIKTFSKIDNVQYIASPINRFSERFLPEGLCILPKNKDSFSKVKFRDLGYFDAENHRWEEFLWKDNPFAFHLRSDPKRYFLKKDPLQDIAIIKGAIDQFISKEL
jgi:hypothetical protein